MRNDGIVRVVIVGCGDIGRVVTVQMAEQVSYFHSSVAYVRGKYADPKICGSGLLLSKCSHDIDLMAWLPEGNLPKAVYSAGSVLPFRPENAPAGATARCLPDCPHVATCPYSAPRLYIDHPQRWARRVWNDCGLADADDAAKLASLRDPSNPYGRCVYRTGLKIVDHQSVLVSFADGATGTFTVTGGAAAPERTIRLVGTKGEIEGRMEGQSFTVSLIAPPPPADARGSWSTSPPSRRVTPMAGETRASSTTSTPSSPASNRRSAAPRSPAPSSATTSSTPPRNSDFALPINARQQMCLKLAENGIFVLP